MGQWREGRVGFNVEELYRMTMATIEGNGGWGNL